MSTKKGKGGWSNLTTWIHTGEKAIASTHVARALRTTSQSLTPWPKGRSAKGPCARRQAPNPHTDLDCHGKKCAKKHIQNPNKQVVQNICQKIHKRLQKTCKHYATGVHQVCKMYANGMQKTCVCNVFACFSGGDLGQYLGWSEFKV